MDASALQLHGGLASAPMNTKRRLPPWRTHLRRLARRGAAMLALAGATLLCGQARADGLNASTYHAAVDAHGIGTLDGAHPPESGSATLAVSSEMGRDLIARYRDGVRSDVLLSRWTATPAITVGLGSAFAFFARAPIIVRDNGFALDDAKLPASGALPPTIGLLVPVTRFSFTDARLSLRGEATLPIGKPEHWRGDGFVTARVTAIYAGPFGPLFGLASGTFVFAPERRVGDTSSGREAIAGIAIRYPRHARLTAVASLETHLAFTDSAQASGLAAAGLELRIGQSHLRALGGPGFGDVVGTPSVWFGLAWLHDIAVIHGVADDEPPPPAVQTKHVKASSVLTESIPPVVFEPKSAVLAPDAINIIAALAGKIASAGQPLRVRILGHAELMADQRPNFALGETRARAVRNTLEEHGVPLEWMSIGFAQSEGTDGDKTRERRVEIFIDAQESSTPRSDHATH